jgi:Domain of unknown function (DUF4383)
MDAPSPARLFASAGGALLVVLGIAGFFYSASFGSPGRVDDMLGAFGVNGWENFLHIATGAIGLFVAGYAARQYALCIGALYVGLAIWGFALGGGHSILGFLPVGAGDDFLHLILGLLGLTSALATPVSALKSPRSAIRASRAG